MLDVILLSNKQCQSISHIKRNITHRPQPFSSSSTNRLRKKGVHVPYICRLFDATDSQNSRTVRLKIILLHTVETQPQQKCSRERWVLCGTWYRLDDNCANSAKPTLANLTLNQYDTIWYDIFTCAQKLTKWPA